MTHFSYLTDSTTTGFELTDVPAVPFVAVERSEVTPAQLPELFDATFAAFRAAIMRGEVSVTGPATALYTRMAETIDLCIGFPGSIKSSDGYFTSTELPAGKVARLAYLGGYEGIAMAWAEFMTHIASAGMQPAGPCWESYVTEPTPDTDPAALRTDLFCLVAPAQV